MNIDMFKNTPEKKESFSIKRKSSNVRIALLDNKTILVERWVPVISRIADEHSSHRTIKLGNLVQKVRMADLNTNVKIGIPGGTTRNIEVNCRKSGCLEWKETNKKEKTAFTFLEQKEEEKFLPDTQGVSSSSTLFMVCDQERAEKIKKALTHALRISGGKDELF